MAIDTSDWETNKNGNLLIHTVTSYQCIPIAPRMMALRLEFATSQEHLDGIMQKRLPPQALQIGLSLGEANHLAVTLQKIAAAVEQVIPSPKTPRQ